MWKTVNRLRTVKNYECNNKYECREKQQIYYTHPILANNNVTSTALFQNH